MGRYWYFADDEDGGTLYKSDGATWRQVSGAVTGGGAVSSVFGRTGAVLAASGDYAGVVAAFLSGATAASRYVGATASGAPASGSFLKGDFVVAQDGKVFVCTAAGSPGTWADVSAGAAVGYATPSIVLGSAAAAGAAATVIRSDATIAAFDATNPSTQAFGDAAAVGTAAFAARRDHKHAMPANPITGSDGAGLTNTAGVLSVNVDGSTIEINIDTLRVKPLGITDGEVATANKDGTTSTPSMRTLGTGAQQAAAGNDSRLSDARTPTAHKTSHEDGGGDEISIQGLAGTSVELANHLADATAAHAASAISIADAGGYFAGTEVEAALQELGATGMDIETPSGTINGSNVTFTLSATPTVPANLLLFKNGLMQDQGVDYTLSGTTITFTTAPATGSTLLAGVPITVGGAFDGIPVDGWVATSGLSYSSADAPTFVIATASDLSGVIPVGGRIKLTQTTVKYFIVTAIDATTITVYGGTDYTLANAAITLAYWSPIKAPLGFPLNPAKWTVETNSTSDTTKASPVSNTWYGDTGLSATGPNISIPIGAWRVYYQVYMVGARAAAGSVESRSALSTSASSLSDADWVAVIFDPNSTSIRQTVYREKGIVVAAKTTYYLIFMTSAGSATSVGGAGATTPQIIRAVCAYL